MTLCLVHHAEAVGPDVDPQRPLSSRGRAHAESLAAEASRADVRPAAIWHSGKLRARQTAEAFLRHCAPFAAFRAVRGLQPDDPLHVILDAIACESADVIVVGHMPHLALLAARLVPTSPRFPLHGAIAFERDGDGVYVERWRGRPDLDELSGSVRPTP